MPAILLAVGILLWGLLSRNRRMALRRLRLSSLRQCIGIDAALSLTLEVL